MAASDREELRLLYVGWTRARDRLVLAGPTATEQSSDKLALFTGAQSLLRHLRDANGPLMREPDDDGNATWAGIPVRVKLRAPRRRWDGAGAIRRRGRCGSLRSREPN